MSTLLPFVVAGLTTGAVYGLAAVGLVLTYKTSGVFNFAHGALATVSAYAFYTLHVTDGVGWPMAAAVCIFAVGPLMGIVMELATRAVATAGLELRVALTVGLLLAIEGGIVLIYGQSELRTVPQFMPSGQVTVAGTVIQYSEIITFVVAAAATAALALGLRRTRRGLAMRAVVDDPDLLDLTGTDPVATRRLAWIIGCVFASLSGVLLAPLLPLDPVVLTLLVAQAFGAAAIGRFTSLPITFAGGLAIGVVAALCTKWFTSGLLAGVPAALPFIALFIVLLVFPRSALAEHTHVFKRVRPQWHAPWQMQVPGAAAVLALLLFVPSFAGIHLVDWTVALAMTIVFLSLGLLVRASGQVSLCHVAFTAIGATAASHLAVGSGLPWGVALLAAGAIAVPVGALLAIPAIRLSGLYLALATLGFGLTMQVMFYTQSFMFGATGAGLPMPRPAFAQSDTDFYFLVLTLTAAVALFVVLIGRGRLGRLLGSIADSPVALSTSGATVEVTRLVVFCLSAFLAAIGGALVGMAQTTVSADAYSPFLSLTYFALIVIVPGNAPWYALVAAGSTVLIPSYVPGSEVTTILQIAFGASAILLAVASRRPSPGDVLGPHIDSLLRRRKPKASPSPVTEAAKVSLPSPSSVATLEVDRLGKRFGGLVAIDDLTLAARPGTITGLIGPNGAGKTTTLDLCSGLTRPTTGAIRVSGTDVARRGPAGRARLGLGRTFQRVELFDSMTVRQNVAMGSEAGLAGSNPLTQIFATPRQTRSVRLAAEAALSFCGIGEIAERRAGSLSTGQRRLVELARCLAGPFSILLLDEPSSGLDPTETVRFGAVLKRVVAERNVGIVLVEHDMSLVLDVCDTIQVLDFGKPIFYGDPVEVQSSPVVQAAYLGDATVEGSPVAVERAS